ncbi:MAG: hypothetical protein IIB04_06630, partial [Acidobacteria bacterium]|nr:hypothetical protein [Acidobacteriota bacterium]
MVARTLLQRLRRSTNNLRSDWIEIGGLGRLAVVGIALSLILTLILGFSITRSARGHLLDARAAMVAAIVEDLPPFPPTASEAPAEYAAFDVAVRTKVLGGETVRVKVWARDGTIVYSDAAELIDQQFAVPIHAALAFENVFLSLHLDQQVAAVAASRIAQFTIQTHRYHTQRGQTVVDLPGRVERLDAVDASFYVLDYAVCQRKNVTRQDVALRKRDVSVVIGQLGPERCDLAEQALESVWRAHGYLEHINLAVKKEIFALRSS